MVRSTRTYSGESSSSGLGDEEDNYSMGPPGDTSWVSSEELFYYFKIVDNYYYQQVDINKVGTREK